MSDSSVKMTFTGDEKSALKALASLERKYGQLEGQIRKTNRATKGPDAKIAAISRNIGSAVIGMVGLGSASAVVEKFASSIREEWTRIVDLQEKSRTAQTTTGGMFRDMLLNFSPDKTLSSDQIKPELQRIAKDTGADFDALVSAAGDSFSAKGSLSNRDVLKAIEAAAKANPFNGDTIRVLSARMLDMQKIQPKLSAEGGAGFLTQIGGAARVTALPKLGKTFTPAAIALRKSGDSLEQSGELFAAVTQLIGDEEGDIAKTALIGLSSQLRKFFDDRKDLTSTSARIEAIQADPKLRQRFLKGASFEKGAEAGILKLLENDADAEKILKTAQQAIEPATDPNQPEKYRAFVASLNTADFQPISIADAKRRAAIKKALLNNDKGAIAAEAEKSLTAVLNAPGIELPGYDPATRSSELHEFSKRRSVFTRGGISTEKFLEQEIRNIRPYEAPEGPFGTIEQTKEVKEQVKEQVKILQDMLEAIRENNRRRNINRNANGERR